MKRSLIFFACMSVSSAFSSQLSCYQRAPSATKYTVYHKKKASPTAQEKQELFDSLTSSSHERAIELIKKYGKKIIHAKHRYGCYEYKFDIGILGLVTALNSWSDERYEWLLRRRGININEQDELGLTPLMYAIRANNLSKVKLLIKYKADVNIPDICNSSPLTEAAIFNYREIIEYLLHAGASPEHVITRGSFAGNSFAELIAENSVT